MLGKLLRKLSKIQYNYPYVLLILFLLFTAFMGYGATKIEFQGDMSEEMPQDLPIFLLNEKITAKFGGQDVMFVLFRLDNSLNEKPLYNDIRHPEILKYMSDLQYSLEKEGAIESVTSPGLLYPMLEQQGTITLEGVKNALENYPQFSGMINDRYDTAIMIINADVGSNQEKVKSITYLIDDEIKALSSPSGVKIEVSGSPSIISAVLDLLKKDSVFTIILASIIIFMLLLAILRSFRKTVVVFLPLLFALTWTIGTMGHLGLKIGVATAGLGAMILGLGVEYGVFMLSRYYEEREKGFNREDSLSNAVEGIGTGVIGSGSTTIVGFLALTFSVMPMLQNLGKSLALGIFFCIFASVFLEPVILLFEEKIHHSHVKRMLKKYSMKKNKLQRMKS